MNIIKLNEVSSTNDYIKENINVLKSNTLVYASSQTNGKGRLGRTWYSNKDENILASIYIDNLDENTIYLSSIIVGCAIHKILLKYLDNLFIKWPNDLIVNDKKICGVLCELINNKLIIGFGINVNQKEFIGEYHFKPTSLINEIKKETDINELLKDIYNSIINEFNIFKNNSLDIINYFNDNLYGKGKTVSFKINNLQAKGVISKVDNNGHLVLKMNNNYITIDSGEIIF